MPETLNQIIWSIRWSDFQIYWRITISIVLSDGMRWYKSNRRVPEVNTKLQVENDCENEFEDQFHNICLLCTERVTKSWRSDGLFWGFIRYFGFAHFQKYENTFRGVNYIIYIYIMWKVKHSSFEAEKIEKSKIWPPVLRPNEQQIVVMYYKNDVVPSTEHFVYILLGHRRAVWWLKTQDKSQTGENVDKWLIVAELTTSDPPNTSTSRYCYYYYLDSWVLILLTALLTIIIVNQFSRWRNPIEG